MKDRIIQDVKFNCDVSDARYWGYFSICGLLFFVFSMEGYRRSLFPELREAMRALSGDVGWSSLENVRTAGYRKFSVIRNDIMGEHRSVSSAGEFEQRIREYLT